MIRLWKRAAAAAALGAAFLMAVPAATAAASTDRAVAREYSLGAYIMLYRDDQLKAIAYWYDATDTLCVKTLSAAPKTYTIARMGNSSASVEVRDYGGNDRQTCTKYRKSGFYEDRRGVFIAHWTPLKGFQVVGQVGTDM